MCSQLIFPMKLANFVHNLCLIWSRFPGWSYFCLRSFRQTWPQLTGSHVFGDRLKHRGMDVWSSFDDCHLKKMQERIIGSTLVKNCYSTIHKNHQKPYFFLLTARGLAIRNVHIKADVSSIVLHLWSKGRWTNITWRLWSKDQNSFGWWM